MSRKPFVRARFSGGHAWSTSLLEHRGPRRAAPVPVSSADSLSAKVDDLGRRLLGHEPWTGADHVAATEQQAVLHELGA